MQLDPEAVAELVIHAVDTAMAPLLERLAVAEALLKQMDGLRDRVLTLEVKSAQPVDLGDIRDRLVQVESRTPTKELWDQLSTARLQSVEHQVKRDDTVGAELAVLGERLKSLEDIRDRVLTLESKAAGPSLADMAITELRTKQATLETKLFDDTDARAIAAVSERLAVVETRGSMPGPAGEKGKDGADGLGFDDLVLEQLGERGLTVKAVRGDRVKDIGTLTFPVDIYRGVYVEGKAYERGDGVTWGGSEWHCNESTSSKPGDGSKAWTLKVKRGRDGKDGRDAVTLPVVRAGA